MLKELFPDVLVVIDTSTIIETIGLLDKCEKKNVVVINSDDEFIGYTDINALRRLIVSGADYNDKLSCHKFECLSIKKSEFENDYYLTKFLKDNEASTFPSVIVTDENRKIVNVFPKEQYMKSISQTSGGVNQFHNNRKVLIIGGGGYLGIVLTELLYKNSFDVRILDSFIYGERPAEKFMNFPRIEIMRGDIRNIETIIKALEDVDSVILLAAIVGDPASLVRPSQTIQTNLLATQAVASACTIKAINRFIYASTCSVYGIGMNKLDENSPLNPVSLYARTKIASEQSILSLVNGYFAPTILRMATLYGYSPRMRFDLVVNTMTLKAYQENLITVFGGNQYRPLLHVEDAAQAFMRVLKADIEKVKGKVYNVGSENQNYRIADLAKLISKSLGNVPIKTELSSLDSRDYKVSFDRIQNELDFFAEHNVEEAARDIYQRLETKGIPNPSNKIYYNHFFDSSEEL